MADGAAVIRPAVRAVGRFAPGAIGGAHASLSAGDGLFTATGWTRFAETNVQLAVGGTASRVAGQRVAPTVRRGTALSNFTTLVSIGTRWALVITKLP